MSENDESSGVFDTEKHRNVKYRADYRRIRRYYKSPKKWRLEKERRRRVLQMYEEGCSYAVIAKRLGVSERTVKRDMAKIRPYYERKVKSYFRKFEEERVAAVKAELEGKSLIKQLEILSKTWLEYTKLLEKRSYRRSKMTVTVNLDAALAGSQPLDFEPRHSFSMKYPFKINFELKSKGRTIHLGDLTISSERKYY